MNAREMYDAGLAEGRAVMGEARAPWRDVVRCNIDRSYRPSGRTYGGRGIWVLTLVCGHVEERHIRGVEPGVGSPNGPPPSRVRCGDCAPRR